MMTTPAVSLRTSATLALVLAATLVAAQTRITPPPNKYTPAQDVELGLKAAAEARRQMPVMRDDEVTSYVDDVGRRLVAAIPADLRRPEFRYSFDVINVREINAFALPGGPVWIHRGVLHSATNESQVAGVLAHEIAHVAQRHAADQLTKAIIAQWGLGFLGALLGNGTGAGAAQVAAGLLANGVFLRFSRDDEREADRIGLRILTRAGWDGRGMVELFEILRREANRDPGKVEVFFSSHPSPGDRIRELRGNVARLKGGRRDSQQFKSIKEKLLRMPPPRAMPRS